MRISQKLAFRNYQPLTAEVSEASKILEAGNIENIRKEIKDVEDSVKRFATDAIELEMQKPKELDLLSLAVKQTINY